MRKWTKIARFVYLRIGSSKNCYITVIKMYVDKFVRPSLLYKRFELGRKILNELLTKDSLLIAMKIRQLKENNC